MNQGMKKKGLVCLLSGALLLTSVFAGCGKQAEKEALPQVVKTQKIEMAGSTAANTYAGEVRGRYEQNLSFQTGGRIIARQIEAGSMVHTGDVLYTLDAKDLREAANRGDAQVQSAQSQLRLAEANLNRYTQLYQESAVSASVLDQYQNGYEAALAAYKDAQAQSAQGHNAVGYATLTAPNDGVVSSVSAEAGQVVAAGQTILTLVQTGELEVEIHVPENKIAVMPAGRNVTVSFWALSQQIKVPGIVREVSPMADPATKTYKIRVSLPQPPTDLRLGMTASVDAAENSSGTDWIELPLSAIYQTGDKTQVWVVDGDQKLMLKDIQVREFGSNSVQASGLSAGDLVVTAGVHRLHEGQDVRLMEGAAK